MLKDIKELKVQIGVYYKGYEIDILLTDKRNNKQVYIDICGNKHLFRNQHILRPNTYSKINFLKLIINFEIIVPDPRIHTNRQQLQEILKRHFNIQLPKHFTKDKSRDDFNKVNQQPSKNLE